MNLSLRDIQYFLAVVEHGQLGRAAEACAVSQPAVSKSLQRLEHETGLHLLERTSRGVRLTSAGLVFLEHARKLNAEYGDAVRNATEMRLGETGLLRIGATGATIDVLVLPTLAALLPHRPALRVQLRFGVSDDLARRVEDGELDLAVVPSYADTPLAVQQEVIGEDDLCVAAGPRHRLATRQRLSLRDLQAERWVLPRVTTHARRRLDAWFLEQGKPPPVAALEVDFFSEGTLELVTRMHLLTVMPATFLQRYSRARLVRLPIALKPHLHRRLSLVSRHGATWSPLMMAFREALHRTLALRG